MRQIHDFLYTYLADEKNRF